MAFLCRPRISTPEYGANLVRDLLRCVVLGLVLVVLSGCGSGQLTEKVEGIVTLDGVPLPEIRVKLEPKSSGHWESGTGSYGLTDEQGRFAMRMSDTGQFGAIIGLHSVIFSDKRIEVEADAGNTSRFPKSRIPEKYSNMPLTLDVKLGQKNVAKFELTSE